MGNRRADPSLTSELRDPLAGPLLVAEYLRAAVREDGPNHGLGDAPVELLANRRMTDADLVPPPNDRSCDARSVADLLAEAIENVFADRSVSALFAGQELF